MYEQKDTHILKLRTWPEVIIFVCSTQLTMKFQLLKRSKILKNLIFLAFEISNDALIVQMNVKIPKLLAF